MFNYVDNNYFCGLWASFSVFDVVEVFTTTVALFSDVYYRYVRTVMILFLMSTNSNNLESYIYLILSDSLFEVIPVEYFGEKRRWCRRCIRDVHLLLPGNNEITLIREYRSENTSLPSKYRFHS
jgi:hypothetical protein